MIGLHSRKNIGNFSQFSVSHRSFSYLAIFATLSASFIGGGYTLGNASKVYEYGLMYAFALFGFSFKEILVGIFMAPRMSKYRDCLSVGDIVEKHYGQTAKVLTGILAVLLCMGILGAQVSAMSHILNQFFEYSSVLNVWIAFLIIIAYSTVGGMHAVVLTDIFQFAVLVIGIPLTLFMGLHYIGGYSVVINQTPYDFIHFLQQPKDYYQFFALFITFIVGEALVPPYIQRLFMGKDETHTQKGIIYSGLLSIPIFLISGGIGLVALTMNSNIPPNEAFPYVVKHVLPIGIKGFVIASIFSIIISSASSFLNAASIAIVNDLLKPLSFQSKTQRNWLHVAKWSTVIIGIGSVFFALSFNNIMDTLLYAYNFWSPILLIPIIIAILGVSVKKHDFFIGAVGGILGMLTWSYLLNDPYHISSTFIGVTMNGLFILCGRFIIKYNPIQQQSL